MNDVSKFVVKGLYSGCSYIVINGGWFPVDEEEFRRVGTVFDYDADLGTYVNGVLCMSIVEFDVMLNEYYFGSENNNFEYSLNEAANDLVADLEVTK